MSNSSSTPSRPSGSAPRLTPQEVDDMITCRRGYVHTFQNGYILPYGFPLNQTRLVCHCGQRFDALDGQKARDHISNCKYGYDESVERCPLAKSAPGILPIGPDNLRNNPEVARSKDWKMCLRMHPDEHHIACVCGKHFSYSEALSKHQKKCESVINALCPVKIVVPIFHPTASERTRIQMSGGRSYMKYIEAGATFLLPTASGFGEKPEKSEKTPGKGEKPFGNWVFQLDKKITNRWGPMTDWIRANGSEDYWEPFSFEGDCSHDHGDHFVIKLSFDGDQPCWDAFWTQFGYSEEDNSTQDDDPIKKILEQAKIATKEALGEHEFEQGTLGTPSLILYKNKAPTHYHILGFEDGTKQFGMLLSPQSTTPSIITPTKNEDVDNVEKWNSDSPWMAPSEELVALEDAQSDKTLKEGLRNLFRISKPGENWALEDKNFQWTSTRIERCHVGTSYYIDGGTIRTPAFSANGSAQCLLSWTWTPNGIGEDTLRSSR